ncbi:MAG: APC family permease [bacterium]
MNNSSGKLTLFDSVGMAVGGMVGGGIFAVLGVAVVQAGSAAFVSFGLAGLLALITGTSYARLTCSFDEPGGSFSFLEELINPFAAGTVSWLLILGYIFTISLYSFTFGEYLSEFVSPATPRVAPMLGGTAIVGLTVLNLVGVRESGVTEDILVYGKVIILLGLVGIGMVYVEPDRVFPIFSGPPSTIVETAAMIFVGYEGFQLLTYDYGDIENHHETLPRAMIGSIVLVTILYMLIAFVTAGTVAPEVVKTHSETVLAMVAQPILGRFGFSLVVAAAVISTASAINATIFATARLGKRVAEDGELPGVLTDRKSGNVPVYFTVLMSLLAFVIQFTGSLERITEFSSLIFLLVFGLVNLAAALHGEYPSWTVLFPVAGTLGAWGADGILIASFYRHTPFVLWGSISMTVGILFFRYVYHRWGS